jgi:hypothetical protein
MTELLHRLFFLAAADSPGWKMWPFTSQGYMGGFWPVVAKFAFIALLFGGIAFFLRFLFGPGGWLREDGWETMQDAKEREAKEQELAQNKTKEKPLVKDEKEAS